MLADCSFSRARRLIKAGDFQRVFKHSKCRSADKYWCLLAIIKQDSFSRLGMAIAKKKIKTAVGRQRIKRLVRESFRQHQFCLNRPLQNGQMGFDIVVMANPAASQATNQSLAASLTRHWEKIINQCNR